MTIDTLFPTNYSDDYQEDLNQLQNENDKKTLKKHILKEYYKFKKAQAQTSEHEKTQQTFSGEGQS